MSTGQPWPDPPAPGTLADLPLVAPAVLLDALGYRGDDQYVAVYLGPQGAVRLDDGVRRDDGEQLAWHRLTSHPVAQPLHRYDLGGAGHEATEWLLIDRDTNRLSIGRAEHVAELLAGQPHTRDRFTGLRTVEPAPGRGMHPDVRAARAPTGPGWQAHAERTGNLLDALTRALDGSQVHQHAADVVAEIGTLSTRTSTLLHHPAEPVETAGHSKTSAAAPPEHGARTPAQAAALWSTADPEPASTLDRLAEVDLA